MPQTDSGVEVAPTMTFTFPGWGCPCGSQQLDPDRLYCAFCLSWMGISMAEEIEEQRGGGRE